jgi:hypothetical protein
MRKIERLNEIFKYEDIFKLGIVAKNKTRKVKKNYL